MKADLTDLAMLRFWSLSPTPSQSGQSQSAYCWGRENTKEIDEQRSNRPQCPHILGHLALTVSYIIPPNTFLSVHQLFGQPGLAPQLRSLSTHASVHEQWHFNRCIQASLSNVLCRVLCRGTSRGCSVQLLTWPWRNSIGDLALMLKATDVILPCGIISVRFRNKTRRLSVWRRSIFL